MTTDNFSEVQYNAGELAVYSDQNNQQYFAKSRLFDQVLAKLIPFLSSGTFSGDPKFPGEYGKSVGTFTTTASTYVGRARAYCPTPGGAYPWVGTAAISGVTLGKNEVAISPGTLFQLVGDDAAGTDANLLAYTFSGSENVTIAAGDPSNPRVDLIEMKLALSVAGPQTRVVAVTPVQAYLDLSTLTTHENTVVQAIVAGASGNNISVAFVSGGSLAYSESGNAITITYVSGTTTVAQIESIIASSSTLINVKTAGTATNVLASPGDSFSSTHLANGLNQVLDAQTIDKTRQVTCTLQVKQGTPASSPVVPTPDAGYCALAMVVVGTSYATTTQIVAGIDTAGANAVLHDLRIPLGVRSYATFAGMLIADQASQWTLNVGGYYWTPFAASQPLIIPIPAATAGGRLLGVSVSALFSSSSNATVHLGRLAYASGGVTFTELADITSQILVADATLHHKISTLDDIESQMAPSAGPTVQPDTTFKIGPPVWCSGHRAPARPFETGTDTASPDEMDMLAVQINSGTTNYSSLQVYRVTFHVAEGL